MHTQLGESRDTGQTHRERINKGGNREEVNDGLYRLVVVAVAATAEEETGAGARGGGEGSGGDSVDALSTAAKVVK